MKLILASQSPRRKELLSMIVPEFEVRVSQEEERLTPGVPPEEAVRALAQVKAESVAESLSPEEREDPSGWCVVGADTVVVIDGKILGKPHSHEECVAMLQRLSGREHIVYTGVAVLTPDRRRAFCETTRVTFYPLSEQEVQWYASTREPYDKAGAYGIQGPGSVLVQGIRGDFFNVMGLPVARLYRALRDLGALPR